MVQDGCVMCSSPIYLSDADELLWTHDYQPICGDCIHQDYLDGNVAGGYIIH